MPPIYYNNPRYYAARSYYGPSLQSNKERQAQQQQFWTDQPTKPVVQPGYASKRLGIFGAAVGSVFAAGFIPTKTGNIWDKYVSGLRTAEEFSPGGILRTFQASSYFSQYTSQVRRGSTFISPEYLKENSYYREYLAKVIGEGPETFRNLVSQGVTLRSNRLYYGHGDEVALKYASAFLPSPATEQVGRRAYIGAAYARVLNYKPTRGLPLEQFFSSLGKKGASFREMGPPIVGGNPIQITGAQTLLGFHYRNAAAIGTEAVERFNRLLRSPVEMALLAPIFSKAGGLLGVQKTGGLRMLGRLGFKYGLGLTAATLGYETLDYFTQKNKALDHSIFDEGLTVGLATVGVKAHIAAAQAVDTLGLHKYREKQEEVAPGSTSLQKLLAYPLALSAASGFTVYGYKVSEMAKLTRKIGPIAAREQVESQYGSWAGSEFLETVGKAVGQKSGWYSRQDWIGSAVRKLARPSETGELIYKGIGKLGPIKLASLTGAAIGVAIVAPFIPGALIPDKTAQELKDIYSGKKEVAVRKGRWWEMGASPYEGGAPMYYRPNWYARMRIGARDKSIWGEEADKLNPLQKWYKREFTYELEEKHYKDQPFPISSLPFEDIPLIGPLLANTVGRLIKPPKLMHQEEWKRGNKTLVQGKSFGDRVATELGQGPGGQPISPYDPTQTFGEQVYRMTEMIGLPGFMMTSLKEKLTGRQDFFDQTPQLESSRRMFGAEKGYWDLELGGMLGSSEALRRLFPHRRRQIDLYNPIKNDMPSWMIGPGDKGPDLQHGSPYAKIQEGELRLPGKGYEARFPELTGVNPEDYPLIHRYRILADVAPYSDKFKEVQAKIRGLRKSKSWTDYDEEIFKTTTEQLATRKQGQVFQEYKYLASKNNGAEQSSETIRRINEINRSKQPEESSFKKAIGSYWERVAHSIETPLDQLTPFSPGSKLMHVRSATESYERDIAYGTQARFWNKPVENFLKPAVRLFGEAAGYTKINSDLQHKRDLESYFDILQYVKYNRLAHMARTAGDRQATAEFEEKKDQTLFGVNPFTRNYKSLMYALPRRERDYFSSFEKATSVEDRKKILQMVPENEKALYAARWKLANADKIRKAVKQGILSKEETAKARAELSDFYAESNDEGLPSSKKLFAEYIKTRLKGETYPDWYRRTHLLGNVTLPPANWVGWHPSVDLEDVKLKVVQSLGEDMHDYNLWESRAKELVNKPYIDQEAIEPVIHQDKLTPEQRRSRIDHIFSSNQQRSSVSISRRSSNKNDNIDVDIQRDKHEEAKEVMKKLV